MKATVYKTVIEKVYAVPTENINIYEEKDDKSRITGTLQKGGLCYVIEDAENADDEFIFIESDDVRGFIQKDKADYSDEIQTWMLIQNEAGLSKAEEIIEPEDNKALYYSLASIKSGVPGSLIRESIVDYASQYIGNPYVWGGTDPINGADCSGLVQTVFRQNGYDLPRTAHQQSQVGEKIAVEDAQPGDLLFYAEPDGHVYHVAIYAGDGLTVEAKNEEYGIVNDTVGGEAFATRLIDTGEGEYSIPEEYDGYPVGTKNCYTITSNYAGRNWGWDCRRIFEVWKAHGSVFTDNVATIDGYYLIACTNLMGVVGDHITWYFDDGSSIETIMADTKSSHDSNYTPWGHITGPVINVIEFEVDQYIHPGTAGCIPQISYKRAIGFTNHGRMY